MGKVCVGLRNGGDCPSGHAQDVTACTGCGRCPRQHGFRLGHWDYCPECVAKMKAKGLVWSDYYGNYVELAKAILAKRTNKERSEERENERVDHHASMEWVGAGIMLMGVAIIFYAPATVGYMHGEKPNILPFIERNIMPLPAWAQAIFGGILFSPILGPICLIIGLWKRRRETEQSRALQVLRSL